MSEKEMSLNTKKNFSIEGMLVPFYSGTQSQMTKGLHFFK